MKCAAASLGIA